MKLNKLTLQDRDLFNEHISYGEHELAAFAFSNIYAWSALFDIRWALLKGALCVFFRDRLGCFLYLPPLDRETDPFAVSEAFEIMDGMNKNKDVSRIENIEEGQLPYYRDLGYRCCGKYPDYLCERASLISLRGNQYKSQRASRNYFIKHYDSELRTLHQSDKEECLGLFDLWADDRRRQPRDGIYRGMLDDSRKVMNTALDNYGYLGFEGVAVEVNRRLRGFTFGYRLNKETFCVFYEITDLSVKGLAQFIFYGFCERLKGCRYINIMDDSGLDNLRKVKLSYRPLRKTPAYVAGRYA